MVETADARTFDEFLAQVAGHQGAVFRGQSREYPAITPSLFRLSEPLDLKPLLKAADDLYMTAHKVIEAMLRLREADQYYARVRRASDYWDDDEEPQGVFGRLQRWLTNKIFPLPDRDDDDDDGINFMNLPVGSGMGTNESYSSLSKYYWSRVPSERLSMAMLQHYGAPSGTLDVS